MSDQPQPTEPLQLQVNTAGAWKTVARYNGDWRTDRLVRDSAHFLHDADPATAWRIATCDSPPRSLHELGKRTGGVWRPVDRP